MQSVSFLQIADFALKLLVAVHVHQFVAKLVNVSLSITFK